MEWLPDLTGALSDPSKPMTGAELIGWVAAIATAVATVVTAAFTFWFRMLDTPSAKFEMIPNRVSWFIYRGEDPGTPDFLVDLCNVGTGPARLVSFIGIDADLSAYQDKTPLHSEHIAMLDVGETVTVSGKIVISRWGAARVLITWSEPHPLAWWSKRMHRSFPLKKALGDFEAQTQKTDSHTGRVELVTVPVAQIGLDKIRDLDSTLEKSENMALSERGFLANQRLMRKLSRAGWQWRQQITKTKPAVAAR